ncbi:MAG: nitrilase family protein [Clostridiales Family XIII bacterium]|jgi:predicted amidohydrolase|nr:nitrilase family protein [Clostridiales Family XIII bacterium]
MYKNKEKTYGQEQPVKVAVVQMTCEMGEKEKNVQKTIDRISEAASNGAKLVVLPEMITSGYIFNTRDEIAEMAERIPGGDTVHKWEALAREKDVYIVAGIPEEDGGKFYNSAVLVGPDGFIGKFRKMHLWDEDKVWYEPGDLGIPVFHTPIGRIAILICYDMWFFEMWRIAAMKGADIVCVPTNWVKLKTLPENVQTVAPYMAMVAANTNCMFVACADRVGYERGITFPGRSLIVGPVGFPSAGPASGTEEDILYHVCNMSDARKYNWTTHNVLFRDRRTDYYDSMLGSAEEKHPF